MPWRPIASGWLTTGGRNMHPQVGARALASALHIDPVINNEPRSSDAQRILDPLDR
jgi:hypothetical protein